jgi:hypothetical protein
MRATFSFLLALAVLLISAGPRLAAADDFIISFWCGPPSDDLDARYAEIAECNFTHAAFSCTGNTPEQNRRILDACEKHGLKFIPADGRIMSIDPSHADFAKNLDAVIAEYSQHPALGGYFITDEPAPGDFPKLAAINQHFLAKDPERLPFINMLPNYVPEAHIGGPYEPFIEKYCVDVKPKLLCYDHYALMEGAIERPEYFENMEIIRRQGLKHGIPIGFIFQITPHFGYRDPSETDLRWQVNTALAYGCRALFYFTYFTPTDPNANFRNGILDAQGKRTPHYDMAKRINAELKELAPELMQMTSTAVYHTGEAPKGCTALPADAPLQVTRGGPLVIGLFKHNDGTPRAIIVNRDLRNATKASVTWNNGAAQFELELPPGERGVLTLE